MKAKQRRKGERHRGKEGSESPISLSLPPQCVFLAALAECSGQPASQYGSLPYVWGEMHRWYGSRPVPRGKRYALRPSDWLVAYIPYCLLLRFYSFLSSHCGQSIAMNSCECGTTNTHSPSLFLTTTTTSSLFDAKPLCVDSVCWLRASLQSISRWLTSLV